MSRVAELIGRSPGTVRAWERGTAVPDDPSLVSTLAAVLGLDEAATFELAGLTPPVSGRGVTVEQALRSLHDPAPERPTVSRPREAAREAARGVDLADPAVGRHAPAAVAPQPSDEGQAGAARPRTGSHAAATDPERPGIMERLRAATVRAPRPVAPRAAAGRDATARAAAPPTTLPAAPVAPSYLEDPTERWSYKMRSVLTAVGVGLLLLVFGWAAANFLDAIGETWDILTSNL